LICQKDVCPNLLLLFQTDINLHRALTGAVVPWPYLIVLLLQDYDPGEIMRANVNSYLTLFAHDDLATEFTVGKSFAEVVQRRN
jgi:hypothetical protein